METLTKSEQVRVEALRFVGRVCEGMCVQATPNQIKAASPQLVEMAQKVEYYIKWGGLPR